MPGSRRFGGLFPAASKGAVVCLTAGTFQTLHVFVPQMGDKAFFLGRTQR